MASKSVYTTNHAESVLSTHRWRNIANSAQFILPYLKPGMRVLDVGCGPGSLTVDIAKHIRPSGRVTGIENVSDPLDEARKLAEQEGVDVTFEVANAMHLPYQDDEFDLVFAHQVLQHVADPVKMLREMRRVTKTGSGVVACRESSKSVSTIKDWCDLATAPMKLTLVSGIGVVSRKCRPTEIARPHRPHGT